jgi:uncharacterized protein (DUF1330 family)
MEGDMNQTKRVGITLLTGVALGAGIAQRLNAQAEKKPAYVVAEVQVTDPAAFQAYAAKVPATLTSYHGRYIVRGKPDAKEGDAPQGVYVILAFDSLADAEKWFSTPPYKDLIPERQKAARSNVFIVEGLPQ